MPRIQNRHIDWERHQIAIPGRHAKDAENRRLPFDPQGRLAPILKRRVALGPSAFVFDSPAGEFVANFKTAWESLLLVANGHDTKRAKPGARVDRAKLRQIDLHWHDLRHEGACRLLADGVDIRTIQRRLARPARLRSFHLRATRFGGQVGASARQNHAAPSRRSSRWIDARAEADGAPGRIRTCDPRLRRPMLYPG